MLKRFYRAKVFRSDHKQDLDQNFIFINKLMFKVYVIHGKEHKHWTKKVFLFIKCRPLSSALTPTHSPSYVVPSPLCRVFSRPPVPAVFGPRSLVRTANYRGWPRYVGVLLHRNACLYNLGLGGLKQLALISRPLWKNSFLPASTKWLL